tara:strand:- start:714 stop:1277 length:564 start_codon:yes stop_codon:yes gene_type:complete
MSDIGEIRESLTKLQYPTENELIDILLFVNNQQQTIDNLTKEVEGLREYKDAKGFELSHKAFRLETENTKLLNANILLANERLKLKEEVARWENELNLQIGWLNVERKKNAKLTKEVEVIENQSEETIEILGRDYTKRKNKLIEENTKLKEQLKEILSKPRFEIEGEDAIMLFSEDFKEIEQILKNK